MVDKKGVKMKIIKTTNESLQQVIDCEKRESRMSDWEHDFIKSLRSQILKNKTLTAKQFELLDIIWDKATSRG